MKLETVLSKINGTTTFEIEGVKVRGEVLGNNFKPVSAKIDIDTLNRIIGKYLIDLLELDFHPDDTDLPSINVAFNCTVYENRGFVESVTCNNLSLEE